MFTWMDGTLPPPQISPPRNSMQIPPAWHRTMFIGWGGQIIAVVCTGISSHIIGRPVFWLDDQRWSAAVLGVLAVAMTAPLIFTALWAYMRGGWLPVVSLVPTAILAVGAFLDRHDSPGAAVVLGILASAGLTLSAAACAARYRPSPHA